MTKHRDWILVKEELISLSKEGKTFKEIGNLFNVSKQRIEQVFKLLGIDLIRAERGASKRAQIEREALLARLKERTGRDTWRHPDDLSRAMVEAFRRKRENAKRTAWGWSLHFTDIDFPMICPILGIDIDWFADFRAENSPSFDRIDNTKGYIPGNVVICSWRANRIKNNGTAEEHRKIADFLFTKLGS